MTVAIVIALILSLQGQSAMAPLFWGLLPLLGFSLAREWTHGVGRRRCIALKLQADGRLEYHGQEGAIETLQVERDSTVMPWLLILLFRASNVSHGRRKSLVLLPDTVVADDFRRLRLWLRWRAKDEPPSISSVG